PISDKQRKLLGQVSPGPRFGFLFSDILLICLMEGSKKSPKYKMDAVVFLKGAMVTDIPDKVKKMQPELDRPGVILNYDGGSLYLLFETDEEADQWIDMIDKQVTG